MEMVDAKMKYLAIETQTQHPAPITFWPLRSAFDSQAIFVFLTATSTYRAGGIEVLWEALPAKMTTALRPVSPRSKNATWCVT